MCEALGIMIENQLHLWTCCDLSLLCLFWLIDFYPQTGRLVILVVVTKVTSSTILLGNREKMAVDKTCICERVTYLKQQLWSDTGLTGEFQLVTVR